MKQRLSLLLLAALLLSGCALEPVALAQRAHQYALLSDYDAAIADLNAALARLPDSAALLTLRGQMYLALYEWDRALEDFNAALARDPAYSDAYFQRGLLYYSVLQTGQELRAEALADFRAYLAHAPKGVHAAQAAAYAALIEAELAARSG
jgi:tetratricopeptide (TPR) repeat protein